MAFSLREALNKNYQRWMAKNIPPRELITLNRKNIFIVPTRNGLLFVLMLLKRSASSKVRSRAT